MAPEATKRYAVVTGANKGIGFCICKQLASNGINVVLTARDEKKGLEAVEKLKELGLQDLVVFHKVDITDRASIASLADFIREKFGKLDILVNNAGIPGATVDGEALAAMDISEDDNSKVDWTKIVTETYESREAGVKTNFYGPKQMTKALIPLLQLSDSPRIVNVSSTFGKLEGVANKRFKEILSDAENLTEEKIDDILNEYKNMKESTLVTEGWPLCMSAYTLSKASLNAYTRVLAKKYPSFCINCVCPGYVKTDINHNTGNLTPDEGAESAVRLALLPNGGPSGLFFIRNEEVPF